MLIKHISSTDVHKEHNALHTLRHLFQSDAEILIAAAAKAGAVVLA